MTMSVGLARIINDPEASILTRKALGALSTPGLLVHDTGLSIDGDGRIVLKLKEDGGIQQDEDGVYLAPEDIVVGIDSHVELLSEAYDRDWNARLTGSAPNYFEAGLAIGSEEFGGVSAGIEALGYEVEKAKVNITSTTTQLRLSYDPSNFMGMRVLPNGITELYSVGEVDAGVHIITGNGISPAGVFGGLRLNDGSNLQRFIKFGVDLSFPGGGVVGQISWQEQIVTLFGWGGASFTPANSIVAGGPTIGAAMPGNILSWSMRMYGTDQFAVRIQWFNVLAPIVLNWQSSLHLYVT